MILKNTAARLYNLPTEGALLVLRPFLRMLCLIVDGSTEGPGASVRSLLNFFLFLKDMPFRYCSVAFYFLFRYTFPVTLGF